MENKTLITIFVIALAALSLFLGAAITGFIVYSVEYDDLCREDADCPGEQCCVIYEDKNLGLCMEHCQSFEFLCQSDEECEEGTVCCLSKGREYGLCTYFNQCLDVDIFADYIGKVSFLKPSELEIVEPRLERPAGRIGMEKSIIIGQTLIIIALIGFIIWILIRKNKKKR